MNKHEQMAVDDIFVAVALIVMGLASGHWSAWLMVPLGVLILSARINHWRIGALKGKAE